MRRKSNRRLENLLLPKSPEHRRKIAEGVHAFWQRVHEALAEKQARS